MTATILPFPSIRTITPADWSSIAAWADWHGFDVWQGEDDAGKPFVMIDRRGGVSLGALDDVARRLNGVCDLYQLVPDRRGWRIVPLDGPETVPERLFASLEAALQAVERAV